MLEVTLRTLVALDCMRAIAAEVPEALLGAGTVLSAADLDAAAKAGAVFAISPGASPALLEAARTSPIPFLPAVMTPSDVITAMDAGFDTFKLFPAAQAGGMAMLKAAPFPQARFCPTGGIDAPAPRPPGAAQRGLRAARGCARPSWCAPATGTPSPPWPAPPRRCVRPPRYGPKPPHPCPITTVSPHDPTKFHQDPVHAGPGQCQAGDHPRAGRGRRRRVSGSTSATAATSSTAS